MASYRHRVYRPDGTYWVSEFRDDDTRTVTTYNEAGAVLSTRPYTAAENAEADADAAAAAAAAARAANRALVKAVITELQAEKTRVQAVIDKANNQVSGADTKEVARAAKRIADAAIDLARFVQDLD
jgi:hypothetical protein